jgi:hypothetical protein
MQTIFNSERIDQCDFIQEQDGQYRAIVKLAFITVVDDLGIKANWGRQQWNSALDVFKSFKPGVLQTIEFKANGSDNWLPVFARVGNKIRFMDKSMFLSMTVGDINQSWSKTNLYSQTNYSNAGAKTWADKAFVPNLVLA